MIANRLDHRRIRRGSILPVVALLMVCLCGFTAMSVEVATIASVKAQCQNAADSAALAGTRTLNGSASSNISQAQAKALSAASANAALGLNSGGKMAMVPFTSAEVTTICGTYHYDTSSQSFYPAYTLASGENYNLLKVSVQRAVKNTFFAVAGGPNAAADNQTIVATAVAAHRPRDIAVILDFSGSMNDESDLWNADAYFGPYYNLSNNSDPAVPAFGHYFNSSAALVSSSTAPGGQSNMTQTMQGTPAVVTSFFQSAPNAGTAVAAFTPALTSYGTQPMGDSPVYVNNAGSGSFATTANGLFNTSYTTSIAVNSAADYFENGSPPSGSQGSANVAAAGYDRLYSQKSPPSPSGRDQNNVTGYSNFTLGPAYWGKTFFQWPPDPRPTQDWRSLYFTDSSSKPVTNNTTLWSSSGTWNYPYNSGTNYHINYKAILNWIKTVGPNPFPPMLRGGRICYYSSIPTDVPASAYDHSQPNSNITDPSQRFWKEYIDYCLGVWRDPYGNVWPPGTTACSYGPDFTWGTVQISARPSGSVANGMRLAYMNYNDNPPRPRHRMWFGPMTMLQYIADTGMSPGTVRDISTYSAKLGITSALQDMQVNHPNDSVALILYNRPQYAGEPSIGEFNQALYNLNRNYNAMINSLWYPPNSSSTVDVTPWDVNGNQTPNADNDFIYNTATHHGLMLAYNQFSGSSTVSSAGAGGLGRVGAQRLVILETDGMANANTNAGFTNNGGVNSYYNILPSQTYSAANYDQNGTLQVAQAICNTTSGAAGTPNSVVTNPGYPGFATSNKPVIIHTIAFGIVFQIATSTQSSAVSLLQDISTIGGTTFPSSPSDPTNGYKWCIGPLSARVPLLQQAFANVLDDGNSVSLVQ